MKDLLQTFLMFVDDEQDGRNRTRILLHLKSITVDWLCPDTAIKLWIMIKYLEVESINWTQHWEHLELYQFWNTFHLYWISFFYRINQSKIPFTNIFYISFKDILTIFANINFIRLFWKKLNCNLSCFFWLKSLFLKVSIVV